MGVCVDFTCSLCNAVVCSFLHAINTLFCPYPILVVGRYRVQRDIPMPLVTSGVENGNLRELALARMRDFGTTCRDVRTREVGIVEHHTNIRPDEVCVVVWVNCTAFPTHLTLCSAARWS